MTARRRKFTEHETLQTLVAQGIVLPCYRCGKPMALAEIEREHVFELALGGWDMPRNCVYSHAECHARITNGTPSTSAGSSKHRIAKDKRIRAGKMKVEKGKKRVSRWAKGRKMQSKGFPRRPARRQ